MSKASEYAARVLAAQNKPASFDAQQGPCGAGGQAWVLDNGGCGLDGYISPEQALQLAQWLIDTFGETK